MSDVVLGLVGKDYVLIACDAAVARSIIVYKDGEDKLMTVSGNKVLGAGGPAADRAHFLEWLDKNLALYTLRAGHSLSTHATANFARNELAEALRSAPFQVNLLIGGCDASTGPSLYFCDYLGALHRVENGAHGYASYFALSLFDRYYKPGMNVEEGISMIEKIISELRLRFLLKIGLIKGRIVDANGIRDFEIAAPVSAAVDPSQIFASVPAVLSQHA